MCGIAGFSTKRANNKHVALMRMLTYLNVSRGGQSTGIYVRKKDQRDVIKKAVSAKEFLKEVGPDVFKGELALAHTRFATMGAVNDENAHPFQFGEVIGVHNGVLNNPKDVYKDAVVDSQALFWGINELGDPEEVFKQLSGTACVAWDDGDGKLNLVKHKNPLAIRKINGAVFFSSLETHLEEAIGVIYGEEAETVEIAEDEWITFSAGEEIERSKVKFKPGEARDWRKGTKATSKNSGTKFSWNNYPRSSYKNYPDMLKGRAKTLPKQSPYRNNTYMNNSDILNIEPFMMYELFMNEGVSYFSNGEWALLASHVFGCDICGKVETFGSAWYVITRKELCLCSSCYSWPSVLNEAKVKEYYKKYGVDKKHFAYVPIWGMYLPKEVGEDISFGKGVYDHEKSAGEYEQETVLLPDQSGCELAVVR